MEKIKTYFVEVVLKKVTSAGVQAGISALVVFLAAHQDYLESLGVTTFDWSKGWPHPSTVPTGMCTLIEWDTLSVGGAATLFALTVMAYSWFQHHAVATVTGKPQSGDARTTPTVPIEGGKRAEDQQR